MNTTLEKLAVYFRFLQLFTHNCHNQIIGETFLVDHPFLGDLYSTYEDIYDGLVERAIGLGINVDLVQTQVNAAQLVKQVGRVTSPVEIFSKILESEKKVCTSIQSGILTDKSLTQGTINMLAGICDESEVRQYKIAQKLK